MERKGRVENGVIVLEGSETLPEGTLVRVTPAVSEEDAMPTWGEMLKDFIGKMEGPEDLSRNLDHYLYGTPRE